MRKVSSTARPATALTSPIGASSGSIGGPARSTGPGPLSWSSRSICGTSTALSTMPWARARIRGSPITTVATSGSSASLASSLATISGPMPQASPSSRPRRAGPDMVGSHGAGGRRLAVAGRCMIWMAQSTGSSWQCGSLLRQGRAAPQAVRWGARRHPRQRLISGVQLVLGFVSFFVRQPAASVHRASDRQKRAARICLGKGIKSSIRRGIFMSSTTPTRWRAKGSRAQEPPPSLRAHLPEGDRQSDLRA